MIGKLFSERKWALALAAGLGLSSLAVGTADAALITFDLRVAGGGKAATVAAPGDVVNLQLYAVVQNLDSNNANDGFQQVNTSLRSTESAAGAQGNIAPVTFNTAGGFIDASLSQAGTQTNLDSNSDLELGSSNPSLPDGFVIANTGTAADFGTGATSAPTEFLLGTTTWTYSGSGLEGSNLNFALRVKTDGTVASRQVVKFVSDGTARSLQGNDPEVALGAPVTVAVPEPTALGLLGLAAVPLLRRRQSR